MSQSASPRRSRLRRFFLFGGLPALAVVGLGFAGRALAFGPHGCHGHGHSPEAMAEHVEDRVERMLDRLDATDQQRSAVLAVTQAATPQAAALMKEGRTLRQNMIAALSAPTLDRARIAKLQTELDQLADRAADLGVDTMLKVAEQLTPAQRAKVAEHLARFAPHE